MVHAHNCICFGRFVRFYAQVYCLSRPECPHTQTQHHLYAAIECNNEQANNNTRITSFKKTQIFEKTFLNLKLTSYVSIHLQVCQRSKQIGSNELSCSHIPHYPIVSNSTFQANLLNHICQICCANGETVTLCVRRGEVCSFVRRGDEGRVGMEGSWDKERIQR